MPHKTTRSKSTTRSSSIPGEDWAAEAQRSGSSLQQHLALGLPATHQDADNDNDATTLFRRPGEWVSQLSSLVGHRTPEKLEEMDAQVRRSVPRGLQPPAARPRPPRPTSAAPRPAARESLGPLHAIEGGLQRSMRPEVSRRQRALALSLPLFAALAGALVWNTPRAQWPFWKLPDGSPTPAAATRSLPMPPPAAPATALPVPAPQPIAAVAELQPEPVVEDLPEAAAPETRASTPSPRTARRARAAARRSHRASNHIRFTRPVMQLPAASEPDEPAPTEVTAGGTLQINSRPWARVLVDGKFVGHTPQRGLTLSAGWHRVRLINDSLGMSKSLDIEIRPGQTARYVEMLDEDAVAKP